MHSVFPEISIPPLQKGRWQRKDRREGRRKAGKERTQNILIMKKGLEEWGKEGGGGRIWGGRQKQKEGGREVEQNLICILMRENPINFCSFSNKLKDNIEEGETSFN